MNTLNIEGTTIATECPLANADQEQIIANYCQDDQDFTGGGTSRIFKYQIQSENGQERKMIIKRMPYNQTFEEKLYTNEIQIMKNQKPDTNMINLEEGNCFSKGKYVYIIMDELNDNILYKLYYGNKFKYSTSMLWRMMESYQMILALIDFHNQGYIHSDIKSENFFLRGNFEAILADFGFSEPLESDLTKTDPNGYKYTEKGVFCGTVGFISNEVHLMNYYKETDIYAMGVTLLEMFFVTNSSEMNDISDKYLKRTIGAVCRKSDPFQTDHRLGLFCAGFYELAMKMISTNVKDRPTGDELKNLLDEALTKTFDALPKFVAKVEEKKASTKYQGNAFAQQIFEKLIKGVDLQDFMKDFVQEMNSNTEGGFTFTENKLRLIFRLKPFFERLGDNGAGVLGKPINEIYLEVAEGNENIRKEFEASFTSAGMDQDEIKAQMQDISTQISSQLEQIKFLI